ncbi:MAG TPA: head GIN domain-containing protein [Eudoraea sp.]|nr:head GIN domain-containing protein [Eudoraea sp.]
MKSRTLSACLIVLACIFTSCEKETIRVSGKVVQREVNLSGYSGLKVSNAFNVVLNFSETEEKIIVEANEDIQDRIVVELEGNDLIVRLKRYTNIRGSATLNLYITTRQINHYDISGASDIVLDDGLTAENVRIALSGASRFTGELAADVLDIEFSGASDADIFGQAGVLRANLSGASILRDYDLIVDKLNLDLSGASNAFLTAMEEIDITASGASTLNYKGNAVVTRKDLSGASEINKKD